MDMMYTMFGTWIGVQIADFILKQHGYLRVNEAETVVTQIFNERYKGQCVCF